MGEYNYDDQVTPSRHQLSFLHSETFIPSGTWSLILLLPGPIFPILYHCLTTPRPPPNDVQLSLQTKRLSSC